MPLPSLHLPSETGTCSSDLPADAQHQLEYSPKASRLTELLTPHGSCIQPSVHSTVITASSSGVAGHFGWLMFGDHPGHCLFMVRSEDVRTRVTVRVRVLYMPQGQGLTLVWPTQVSSR